MAVYCPDKRGPALYLDCKECEEKHCKNFFCLVVGSRSFNNYGLLKEKLDFFLSSHKNITIVSGGAKGADSLAEKYAKEKRYNLCVFPADWDLGKKAGPIRNEEMHRFIANFEHRGCVAFWDGESRGTQHNFALAEKYKTPLKIVKF